MGDRALILITFIEIVKLPRVVGLSPLAVALSFNFSVFESPQQIMYSLAAANFLEFCFDSD